MPDTRMISNMAVVRLGQRRPLATANPTMKPVHAIYAARPKMYLMGPREREVSH